MALQPTIDLSTPSQSNHDRSNIIRFDTAPGVIVPFRTDVADIGDQWRMNFSANVITSPPTGPLMGSCECRIHSFFVPSRLYIQALHNDKLGFDPSQILFPQLRMEKSVGPTTMTGANSISTYACTASSLFAYIYGPYEVGMPLLQQTSSAQTTQRTINATPILGYYDIFKNYFANVQEPNAYIICSYAAVGDEDAVPNVDNIYPFPLSDIDDMRLTCLSQPSVNLRDDFGQGYLNHAAYWELLLEDTATKDPAPQPDSDTYGVPFGGLCLCTHAPDRFTQWLSLSSYENVITKSRVTVGTDVQNQFSVDSLIFAEHIRDMLLRTAVSGGTYADWGYVQYGRRMNTVVEAPMYLGSNHFSLGFEDIYSTVATTVPEGSESPFEPLGTLASRGRGGTGGRSISFTASEHGFIMHMFSIRPNVDYYQGMDDFANMLTFGDIHIPALDAIAFQDLLVDTMYSRGAYPDISGETEFTALGKQPAWVEYTTKTNALHGEFAEPLKKMYMTFARTFGPTDAFQVNVTNGNLSLSTYIHPRMFQQNFAVSELLGANFWVQISARAHVRKLMSKHVMPKL